MGRGEAPGRLPVEPSPIVFTLLAWSRRLIAVFLAVAFFSLCWFLSEVRLQGKIVSFDLGSLWSLSLLTASTGVVGVTLFLRGLARHIESEIRFLGSLDALTGLSNRTGLMDRLDRPAIAVLYLDLDYFKKVNDSLGHDAGDDVIKVVAQRLKRIIRPGDLAARLGGDEFVVVVEDEENVEKAAETVAERIRSSISMPIKADRRALALTSSIGVAVKSPQIATPNEILRAADLALYRAKRQGRDRVVFYNDAVESNVLHRLDLEKDLWKAMDRDELELDYLPEVSLQSGALTGLEALVRWRHPEHGLLRPHSFMGLAEETGSAAEIGLWAMKAACRDWVNLRRTHPGRPLTLGVNFSSRQLAQAGFIRRIEETLAGAEMDTASMRVEISERVFLEAGVAEMVAVQGLRSLGLAVVIDDLGTGHAPLSYLRQWPVQGIKIDRTLVSNLEFDDSKLLIVQAIISLAHDLGLQVTAVGIETPQQLSQLFDLGCDFGQGYYLSQPIPSTSVAELLARGAPHAERRPGAAAA